MALSDERYILVTTYKRDGTPVSTPTWAVPLDGGRLGFWTSSGSGKAKRLARNGKVLVQPCNQRGKVRAGTSPVEGSAVLVEDGPELEAIRAKVKAKYGVMTTISKVLGDVAGIVKRKRIPYGDRGVVVTLEGTPG
jgi:PPOX class probable F420-dependent enzyme